ncbi:MAG TPA: hypothetical protein GX506_09350 [Firmicutes bacterium]|nr:hypothetical protein [Bacillota bacterium]
MPNRYCSRGEWAKLLGRFLEFGDPCNKVAGVGRDVVEFALNSVESVVLDLPVIEQGANLIDDLGFKTGFKPQLVFLYALEALLDVSNMIRAVSGPQ